MRRILVIFGGCSTEYEVSLQSAAAVAEAIDVSRYEVLYLGISREGEAYYYTGDTEGIRNGSWQKQALPATVSMSRGEPVLWIEDGRQLRKVYFDMAFPVMHGKTERTAPCRDSVKWRIFLWWAAVWKAPASVWTSSLPTHWQSWRGYESRKAWCCKALRNTHRSRKAYKRWDCRFM